MKMYKIDRRYKRGFASMDSERVREIARSGGKKAQASGNAHRFTPQEAAAAGKKGGASPRKKKAPL